MNSEPLFDMGQSQWLRVKDADPRVAAIYRRHYSCHQYKDRRRDDLGYRNRNHVMGPGEKLILLSVNLDAIFGWRKFIDMSGQQGINCAFFRNEGSLLSSDLIRDAENYAWARWPGQRWYTYVNPKAIRSKNPGFCFKMAGWHPAGQTKSGLIILEKYRENAPIIVSW